MENQKILVSLFLVGLLSLPLICGAAVDVSALTNILQNIINAILAVVAFICTLMIIWGGIVMITAAGSPDKVVMGRQIILWAVIGLVVCLIAYAITNVVLSVTGAVQQ